MKNRLPGSARCGRTSPSGSSALWKTRQARCRKAGVGVGTAPSLWRGWATILLACNDLPGFRGSRFSYVMSLLHPRVIRDLDLGAHGLEVLPANDLFCPLGGDDYIVFSDDLKQIPPHSCDG